MSQNAELAEAAARVRAWLDQAWPLWIARGIDPATHLFVEQLDMEGRPDLAALRRVRVQGRQLWCLSRAIASGHDARAVLDRSFDAVWKACWGGARAPGWIHLVSSDGRPANQLRDTYDQAFLLFGLAGLHDVGFERAAALADATFAFVDTELTDARDGSLWEGVPDSLPRRSNPHMHMLEACLAWHASTGERTFLERANRVAALFRGRFFDPGQTTLGEFFTTDWQRAPGAAGDSVEPGHHFEWSWLLHRLARAGGLDLRAQAGQLYRWAIAHGLDGAGFAVDECDRSGRQCRMTRRLWPQTELIKGHLANGAPADAARVTLALFDTYLATPTPGLWFDQFDAAGQACVADVPASTFYHLVLAFEDLLQAAG